MPGFQRHQGSTKITLVDLDKGLRLDVYEEDLRDFIKERDKEIQTRQLLYKVVTEYLGRWNEDHAMAIVGRMYDALTATWVTAQPPPISDIQYDNGTNLPDAIGPPISGGVGKITLEKESQ